MKILLAFSRAIDTVSSLIGRGSAWLILIAVLVSAGNASIRKAFQISSNSWLELQWYLYGTAFMLAAAYTLERNEHVRIDFVYNSLKKRSRYWVDLIGHLVFLLPFTVMMVWLAYPWFMRSVMSCLSNSPDVGGLDLLSRLFGSSTCEVSVNAGGLILWPAKIMVLLGFILLTFQALSEIIKRVAVIRGDYQDPRDDEHQGPPAAREMASGADDVAGEMRT